jgi:hypothetical protein
MFDCNCSNCRKHGVLWGYLSPTDVDVSGETNSYTRADRDRPSANIHFCKACGCTTHWTPTANFPQDSMGTNMRLFVPEELTGIALHFPDGIGWSGQGAFVMRSESAVFEA